MKRSVAVILATAAACVLAGCATSRLAAAGPSSPAPEPAASPAAAGTPTASTPAASASWPQCHRDEVHAAARGTGAALGHVGVLFTLHNVSRASCRILGYAGLRLLSRAGRRLPTTVHHAASGTYLFPPAAPHWVALRPGAFAAFELEYGDNPSGAQASEPYARACPAATQAEVTWPGARGYSVVAAAMAPCGGAVWISPVIPGRQWIAFP